MEIYGKSIGKYLSAGVFGALVPSYLLSLIVKKDIREAAEFSGILLGSRAVVAWVGSLPYLNRVPILNGMHYLFLPEFYGFIAGLSAASVFDDNINRNKGNVKKNLETILEKPDEKTSAK